MEFTRRDAWSVCIICTLALVFRVAYLADYVRVPFFPVLPFSDSSAYLDWGRSIASGDILGNAVFMKWPGYAYFLGGLFFLSGPAVVPVYVFQFLLGAIHCGLVYVLAARFFSRPAAFAAGTFCAVFGLFIFYEGLLVYSTLSLFLNTVFFIWLISLRPPFSAKKLFTAGIVLGVCVLTQASILFFGVIAAYLVLSRHIQGKDLARRYLVFLAGVSIVVGGVTARNYLIAGDPVILAGNTGFNFYCGNNAEAGGTFFCPLNIGYNQQDMFRDAALHARAAIGLPLNTSQVSAYWTAKALDFIRTDPLRFLLNTGRKILLLFSPFEYVHDVEFNLIRDRIRVFRCIPSNLRFFMPLALWGMVVAWKDRKRVLPLYLFILAFAVSVVVFFVTARYKLALVPVLMVFAGNGADALIRQFRQRHYLRAMAVICMVVFLAAISPLYGRLLESMRVNKVNSLHFDAHISAAGMHALSGDFPRALEDIDRARVLEPKNARADFRSGWVYYQMGELGNAERMFLETIRKNPLSFDAHYNLGCIMNGQNRAGEARQILERACVLDPSDPRSRFQLALALKALGDTGNARKEFLLSRAALRSWQQSDIAAVDEELAAMRNQE